jgi:hypothetical protein
MAREYTEAFSGDQLRHVDVLPDVSELPQSP